ncbi:patatin-like phospholipase family protein [Bacteriovoracaceae bacterium]|nr:patatin-like phospholipase family protein [Bacteriovoracaceae bacterium]
MSEKIQLSDLHGKKIAIVLSGGVVKAAAWHLGVMLALDELGFVFVTNENYNDPSVNNSKLKIGTYVGSSAGSMINLYIASGYSAREVINATLRIKGETLKGITYKEVFSMKRSPYSKKLKTPKNIFEDLPLPIQMMIKPFYSFNGFFTTMAVKEYLEKHILKSNRFEDFHPDIFVVATQLDHSRKVIFSKYHYPNPSHDNTSVYYTGASMSDAAAASMSVPPFYSPHPILNSKTGKVDYYIDGEIRETLSTHVAEDHNCDYIISSWTHTPYHFQDEIGSLVNYGLPPIIIQTIYLLIQKKIVSHRANRNLAKDIIKTVNQYLKENKITGNHRDNIISILEKKLTINRQSKLIDIYPDHNDYKLFFANSFSLNPKVSSYAVKMGYKKTLEVFRNK